MARTRARPATSTRVTRLAANASTAAYLAWSGVTGAWADCHPAVRVAALASAAVTGAIALGLSWSGLRRDPQVGA